MSKSNLLAAAFVSLFSTKSVDGILSSINRNIVQLDKAATKHRRNGDRLEQLAEKLDIQASKAYREALRADKVKLKLSNLIG